jgi:hypothetical protein
MMTDLVRQHVGLGEFTGRSEAVSQFVKKAEVNVDLLVRGTIKRAGSRLSKAAGRICGVAEEHKLSVPVGHIALLRQKAIPGVLRVVEDKRNELHELGFGGVLLDAARGLIRRRGLVGSSGEESKKVASENNAEQQ